MPTKRRPIARSTRPRITPELVELYRRCLEIIEAGQDEAWEDEGGRRRELLDAHVALMSGLGLRPWHYSPLWVSLDGPPAPHADPERHALAQQLRRALEAALDSAG